MAEDKNSGADFGEILQNAMSDPRFTELLNVLKEKSESGELDINSLKESVLSGKSGDVISAVNGKKQGGEKHSGGTSQDHSQLANLLGNLDNHKRLLSAIRPYLSENKREAVDGILQIGKISEIAEKLGGLGGK